MNLHKRLCRLSILVVIVFWLSGCGITVQSPVDLIKRPVIETNQRAIRTVIDSNLPLGSTLIRPLESDNLGSVGIFDWDSDGIDDFYAFYRNTDLLEVGVLVIKQIDGNWKLAARVREVGVDIAFAEFSDFNDDGIKDVILGVSAKDEIFRGITAFQYTDKKRFEPVFKELYSELRIEDVNLDGQRDMLLFKLDRNKFASAHLIEYANGVFKQTSEIAMDAFVSGYYAISYGKVSSDRYGFVLDFSIGSKSASNILYLDKGSLKLAFDPFADESTYQLTIKESPITSRDVDGDGIIEVGNRRLPSNYYEWSPNPPFFNMWYQWDGIESLNLIVMNYIDEAEGYRLDFPEFWTEPALSGELLIIKSHRIMDRSFLDIYLRPDDAVLYKMLSIEILTKVDLDLESEEKPLQMKIGETEDKVFMGSILDLTTVPAIHYELCRSLYLDIKEIGLYFSIQ